MTRLAARHMSATKQVMRGRVIICSPFLFCGLTSLGVDRAILVRNHTGVMTHHTHVANSLIAEMLAPAYAVRRAGIRLTETAMAAGARQPLPRHEAVS